MQLSQRQYDLYVELIGVKARVVCDSPLSFPLVKNLA